MTKFRVTKEEIWRAFQEAHIGIDIREQGVKLVGFYDLVLEGEVEEKCSCGEPWTERVMHRKDKPCYWPERKTDAPLEEEVEEKICICSYFERYETAIWGCPRHGSQEKESKYNARIDQGATKGEWSAPKTLPPLPEEIDGHSQEYLFNPANVLRNTLNALIRRDKARDGQKEI